MKPWSKTIHFYQAILVFCLVAAAASQAAAAAAGKVALVIGNSQYKADPLPNPVNDAADMAGVLENLGFEVILEKDADKSAMVGSLREFHKKLGVAEIGLFYYAGHGMQINGSNYLIPVRHAIADEFEVEYEAISADRILSAMESAGNPLNIVILDACRNNPFQSFRGAQKGLAEMKAPRGTIISYATSPGSLAEDGRGRNGTYTEALLKNFQTPGVDVQKMFNRTGLDVMEKTDGRQMPWVSTTPFPDYYLAGGAPGDQNLMPAQAQPVQQSPVPPSQPPARETPEAPQKARLYVVTDPGGGQVRIMNIVDKYYDGIELDPGRFKLEGSMDGFRTKTQWVTIGRSGDVDVTLTLTPEPAAPAVAAPSVTAPAHTTPRIEPATSRPAAASQASSPRAGDVWKEPVMGMEFVWVPKGCFRMGCGPWTSGCVDLEKPVHEVCLSGFWIGKYEVTQGQWQTIMGSNPSHFKSGDDHPVERVSSIDAKEFISKLNQRSGQWFALPSEAQWEYAARSGGREETFAGGNSVDRVAWYSGNSGSKTHRVGTKAPNGLGIHDMSGNVWEWCEDVFDENAYAKHTRNNPLSTSGSHYQVNRGGSWRNDLQMARATTRWRFVTIGRNNSVGFRLVLSDVPKNVSPKFHTVQKGETLWRISQKYNITLDKLRELNNLEPFSDIYSGVKIRVR